jgi:UPF0148 protein
MKGVTGMEAKNPDDIMAECLLAGGRMLSKSCRACGSPLFEVKGETLCVVCREKGKKSGKGTGEPVVPAEPSGAPVASPAGSGEGDPAQELRMAIVVLARRAREEGDPGRCMALMEAAKNGALALSLLQR